MTKLILTILFTFLASISWGQKNSSSDTLYRYFYKTGELSSIWIFKGYNNDLQKTLLFKGFYKNGLLALDKEVAADTIESNSTQYYYYKSGNIKSKFIRPQSTYFGASDYYSGYSISYYKNRQIREEGSNLLNKGQTGLWTYYYDNGKIKKQGKWKNFKKTGKWDYYKKNGILSKTKNYK